MRPPDDREIHAWLAKAAGDLRMARMALEADEPLFDQACFHAQQAVEKSLKGLLVAHDLDVPHSHDLVFLAQRVESIEPGVKHLTEKLAVLGAYGVTPRYPSFLEPETEQDAVEAVSSAQSVMEWVRERLGPSE